MRAGMGKRKCARARRNQGWHALVSCREVALTGATENARSTPMSTPWLPKGFRTMTPNIVANDAEGAVAFLKKALRGG